MFVVVCYFDLVWLWFMAVNANLWFIFTKVAWLDWYWDNYVKPEGPGHTQSVLQCNTWQQRANLAHNCWCILTLIARFMGPTWGPSGADRTQVGPTLAPWTLLYEQWYTAQSAWSLLNFRCQPDGGFSSYVELGTVDQFWPEQTDIGQQTRNHKSIKWTVMKWNRCPVLDIHTT